MRRPNRQYAFRHVAEDCQKKTRPAQNAAYIARPDVAVWHGNYYALELSRWLGLEPDGALRAGVVAYNDGDDVDRLEQAIAELSS